ncbi:putative integral membrane protein [Babesia bovis T2Bo]|uniref:putative integral membrane protein n=1 Tax=Babesia bovis T2Bo TaxID=484906 RepID=UPI001C355BC0|nr:putative integral membrane protein [Babesia bovis T2Bo]EDO06100.2 putative integral membrane protein [Babesia bovis T2Bo]
MVLNRLIGRNVKCLVIFFIVIPRITLTEAWKDERYKKSLEYAAINDVKLRGGVQHPEDGSAIGERLNYNPGVTGNAGPKNVTKFDNSVEQHDVLDDGKSHDGYNVSSHEGLLNTAYFNTLLVIVSMLVVLLTLVSKIEFKLQTKDKFMRQAFDICVRQVVIMSLVNLGLYMAMHTDLADRLDYIFNKDIKHVEVFDTLLQISFFLFCFFFLFCVYIAIVVGRGTKFLSIADEADVVTTAKEYDFSKNNFLHFFNTVTDKAKYMVNRMEFTDMVKQRGYSDNCGCYFMDYMRASLIQISIPLLRISRGALFVLLVALVILRIIGNVDIFRTIYYITIANTLAILALASRISHLDSQLYPLDISQYLLLKLNVGDVGDALQPLYKGGEEENQSEGIQNWLFGEGAINAHQNIFWLKQYGPVALESIFGTLLFSHLLILSVWTYSLRYVGIQFLKDIRMSTPLFATLLVLFLVPKMLYSLMVVTRCGHLINFELLESILLLQKTENAKNATELLDALSIESVRFAFVKGGDEYWRMLLAKQKALPPHINQRIKLHWESISSGKATVDNHKLAKYLSDQWGFSGKSDKHRMKEFISQFMRNDTCRMNEEEFMVFGYKIKHMILAPLEEDILMILFEDKFDIPWKAPCGIDLVTFDSIIRKLNLKWKKSAQRHFLEFIGSGPAEGLSPENLICQLNNFQRACQKNYFSAV